MDELEVDNMAMKEYNLKLNLILDNIQEAVCIIDKNYIVKFWNEAAENLYNVKKEDLCGKNIKEKFQDALLIKTLQENKIFSNIKHKPNDTIDVVLSTAPIIFDGELIGAISTDRDVSQVEKLSKKLSKERERVEALQNQVLELTKDRYGFEMIISNSQNLKRCIELSKKVAGTDATVMITGESGTGKDVFARAIHKESGRKGSFIPINCSAIPSNLLESELFGYEKGTFTGANKSGKVGKFELAHEGTMFLDEIGDMPIVMQAKLLRVLQDGFVYRIGGKKGIKVNTRIIAATNKNLKELMETGEFREDLYYRLNVVSIELPPLRNRKEDIPELIYSFISEFSNKNNLRKVKISNDAMKILVEYNWKGNIRELRNIIERMVILNKNNLIDTEDIPKDIIRDGKPEIILGKHEEVSDLNLLVARIEKQMILRALELEGWNKARSAERLNIKRSTLYYKMDLYGIEQR